MKTRKNIIMCQFVVWHVSSVDVAISVLISVDSTPDGPHLRLKIVFCGCGCGCVCVCGGGGVCWWS